MVCLFSDITEQFGQNLNTKSVVEFQIELSAISSGLILRPNRSEHVFIYH